jgi:hypothetical protein
MPVRITKPQVNIREKLSELERPIGLNGSALIRTDTPQEAFSLIGAGRKNLIINGDFSVSQRGNYTSSTPIVHNVYYLDRWISDVAGVTATFRQITTDLPKQYRNLTNTGLRFEATSSSSNAYVGFRQKYEFMSGLDGKYVTVSAWVKSNKRAVIINYDGTGSNFKYAQHSGGGGWEYLSYTTYISSTSYNLFDIWLIDPITYAYTPISSGDYVEVTNYQVEIGRVATPFEHRSYAEELALCQRYYYKFRCANQEWIYNESNASDGKWHQIYIGHPMRANPSVDVGNLATGGSVAGLSGVTISSISPQTPGNTPGRISSRITMSGTAGSAYNLHHTDAWQNNYIALSAEI